MQEYTKVFIENKCFSNKNKNYEKNISNISSSRDSVYKGSINENKRQSSNIILVNPENKPSSLASSISEKHENFILKQSRLNHEYNFERSSNKPLIYHKNIFSRIKLVINRFSIGRGRSRHSEAYHQDGKTNPFE
ncbi:9517_t:CDS:1 [Funneliformis geosporum]|uniref:18002_t:CDS:1 n=1 Tax=Funneliformis geosporum TaxID=1117311 RepID=A0A9W4SVY3_9GLOM|nr:9517_t:CDS:1 [Funneliformis geosporum]CAI2183608.1 18002_t:CDS:1 [Funneliformis geosporum]